MQYPPCMNCSLHRTAGSQWSVLKPNHACFTCFDLYKRVSKDQKADRPAYKPCRGGTKTGLNVSTFPNLPYQNHSVIPPTFVLVETQLPKYSGFCFCQNKAWLTKPVWHNFHNGRVYIRFTNYIFHFMHILSLQHSHNLLWNLLDQKRDYPLSAKTHS